jgi:hypothetical protein
VRGSVPDATDVDVPATPDVVEVVVGSGAGSMSHGNGVGLVVVVVGLVVVVDPVVVVVDPVVVVVDPVVVVVDPVVVVVDPVVVVGWLPSTVMTLLSVEPEPSSTTSIFHMPGGARLTLRQETPWLSTFGMMNGPYLIGGLASWSVTKSCEVVEMGVSPVIKMLNGGVTLGELPFPAQSVAS